MSRFGPGLMDQQSNEMTVTAVHAELHAESPGASPSLSPSPSPSASHSPKSTRTHHAAKPQHSTTSQLGTPLGSPGGTVWAVCQPGGAYLVKWQAAQGYDPRLRVRGPARTAIMTFRGPSGSVTMGVSCNSGVPVKELWHNHDTIPDT